MVNWKGATMDDKRGVIGAFFVLLGLVAFVSLFLVYPVQVPALAIVLLTSMFGLFVAHSFHSVYSRTSNGFIENNDPQAMALRMAMINRWRKLTGKSPILVLPASKSQYMALKDIVDIYVRRLVGKPPLPVSKIKYEERQLANHANLIVNEIKEALNKSPISTERKQSLLRQVHLVPLRITEAMWRLYRLRMLQDLPYTQKDLREVREMEYATLTLMHDSVGALMLMPLSLMRIEIARADTHADRLIAEIGEINKRLQEQCEAYVEVRSASFQGSRRAYHESRSV
jgi:hypothetical protein